MTLFVNLRAAESCTNICLFIATVASSAFVSRVFHEGPTTSNNRIELVCETVVSQTGDSVPKTIEFALDGTGLRIKSSAELSSASTCTQHLKYTPLNGGREFTDRTNNTAAILREAGTRCEVDTHNRISRALRIVMIEPNDILLQQWTCTITPKSKASHTQVISYDTLARLYSSRVPTDLKLNIGAKPHPPSQPESVDDYVKNHQYSEFGCFVEGLNKARVLREHSPPNLIIPVSPVRFFIEVGNNNLDVFEGRNVIFGDIYGRIVRPVTVETARLDGNNRRCVHSLDDIFATVTESLKLSAQTSCFDGYPRQTKGANTLFLENTSCTDYALLNYDSSMKRLPLGRMNNVVPRTPSHVLEVDDLLSFLEEQQYWCVSNKHCRIRDMEPIYQKTFETTRLVIKIPEPSAIKCITLTFGGDDFLFIGDRRLVGGKRMSHTSSNRVIYDQNVRLCPTAELWSEYYAAVATALLKYKRITLKLIGPPQWYRSGRSSPYVPTVKLSCSENGKEDREVIFIANGRCADANVKGQWCGKKSPYAIRRVRLRQGQTWRVTQQPHRNRRGQLEYYNDMTCMWRAYICVDKARPQSLHARELLVIKNKVSYQGVSLRQGPFDVMPDECIYSEKPGTDKRTYRICGDICGGKINSTVMLHNVSTVFQKKLAEVAMEYGSAFRAAIPFDTATANLDRLCPCRPTVNTCPPSRTAWTRRVTDGSLMHQGIIGTISVQTHVLLKLLAVDDNVQMWCEALGRHSNKYHPSQLLASSVCTGHLNISSRNAMVMFMRQHFWMLPKPRQQLRRQTGHLSDYVQITCDHIPKECSKAMKTMSSLTLMNNKNNRTLTFYHDAERETLSWLLVTSSMHISGVVKSTNDTTKEKLLPIDGSLLVSPTEEIFGVVMKRAVVKAYETAKCAYGLDGRISSPLNDLRRSIDKAASVCIEKDYNITMSRGGKGVITCSVAKNAHSPCAKPSVSLIGTGFDNFGRSVKYYSALCEESQATDESWRTGRLPVAESEGIAGSSRHYCHHYEKSVYIAIVTNAKDSRLQNVEFQCAYSLRVPAISGKKALNHGRIKRECIKTPQLFAPEVLIERPPHALMALSRDDHTTRVKCRYPTYLGNSLCKDSSRNRNIFNSSIWAEITSLYTKRISLLLATQVSSSCVTNNVYLSNCTVSQLPETDIISVSVSPLVLKDYINFHGLRVSYKCVMGEGDRDIEYADHSLDDRMMAEAIINLRPAVLRPPPPKSWDAFVTFATPSNNINPEIFLTVCQVLVFSICLSTIVYIGHQTCRLYLAKRVIIK